MSFWKDKPVSVTNKTYLHNENIISKKILSVDNLFNITKTQIENNKIQLDYDIILNPNDTIKHYLLNFINDNYMCKNSELTLIYNIDLLNYFLSNNSLCIIFYTKGTKNKFQKKDLYNKIIGIIIGKPQILNIRNIRNILNKEDLFQLYNSIDVDFLCIKQQLRNLHISSYMINVLTHHCIIEYQKKICCAIYTTNLKLKVDPFCKSIYYNRPLQIDKLLKCEILFNDNIKPKYNIFNYPTNFLENKSFEYFNQSKTHEYYEQIYNLLQKYNKTNYDIYAYKSKNDIIHLLKNQAFHKFIIKDTENFITDFICLYKLETKNLKSNYTCQNGYIYSIFLQQNDNTYKSNILELISEYCYKHNIFDMIVMLNIFNTDTDNIYNFNSNLIETYPNLYYYIYNIEMPNILPFRNGLITI